jgi:hypothetical protein
MMVSQSAKGSLNNVRRKKLSIGKQWNHLVKVPEFYISDLDKAGDIPVLFQAHVGYDK